MPKPTERVQLTKQEDPSRGGGDEDFEFLNGPLNPDEDAPEVGGIFFQSSGVRDSTVAIYRESDEMWFEDTTHSGIDRVNLDDLTAAGTDQKDLKVSSDDTTAGFLDGKLIAGSGIIFQVLNSGGNEQLEVTSSGVITQSIKYRHYIWAEEAAVLGDGNNEWSYGNGATGVIGIPIFNSGSVVGMMYNADVEGDGTTEVEVRINGSSIGRSITPASGQAVAITSFAPYEVDSGDLIGFQTVTAGGASDVRVVAVVEHEMDISGFRGEQGPPGASPLTVKGDLFTYDTDDARLPVGASGQFLSVNPNEAVGIEWVANPDNKDLKVSTNDTTADFLEEKVVAGSGILLDVLNNGEDEQLQISFSGINESEHDGLDTLVHNISENHYEEWTYEGPFWRRPTNVTVYADETKVKKIREESVTYSGFVIKTATLIQYDENGNEKERLEEEATYSGFILRSISGVRILT